MADIVSLKSHDAPHRPVIRFALPPASGVTWPETAEIATGEAGFTLHDSLEEALTHGDGDPIVIGLQAPRTALAALISAGADPEGAFGSWMERLTGLLLACRPHRRRICCVDMEVLTGDPEAVAADIRARFGFDGTLDTAAMAAAVGRMVQGADIDPGSRIMADWLVDRHAEAIALAAEVRAMMALRPEPGPAPLEMAGAALAEKAALAEEAPLLRASLERLLADLDEATRDSARAQDRAEGLAARIAEMTEAEARLHDRHARTVADLQARIGTLGAERDAMRAERTILAEEAPLLRASLERLLADLDEATQDSARAQDRAEGLAARIAEMTEAEARLHDRHARTVADLQARIGTLGAERDAMRAEKAALTEETSLLRTSLERLLADLDEARQDSARAEDEARARIEDLATGRAALEARIAALSGERERLEAAIEARDRQLSAERAGRAEAEARGTTLAGDLKTARTRIDTLSGHLKTARDRIGTQSGALETARSAATRLRGENARLKARIGELEGGQTALRDEIAALHRSTSWRLTAPLRGLRTGLARIIGR